MKKTDGNMNLLTKLDFLIPNNSNFYALIPKQIIINLWQLQMKLHRNQSNDNNYRCRNDKVNVFWHIKIR